MTSNKTLSVLLFVSMTFASLSFLGKEALAGGFGRTCSRFNLESTFLGFVLNATCRDRGGQLRPTRLNLEIGIGNVDGRLVPKSGGFSRSCQVAGLFGTTLRARCAQARGGLLIPTSLDLNNVISNQDGRLEYDP